MKVEPGQFANRPRICSCRATRVDTSDHVDLRDGIVSVHGMEHCFHYARAALTLALGEQS